MSDFLSSLKGKAQSAFTQAQAGLTGAPDPASGHGGGLLKSHAFESIHHQLRNFQQQYSYVIMTPCSVCIDLNIMLQELRYTNSEDHHDAEGHCPRL